ncbi:MAG: hypothetical protein IKC54_01265 [Clostridia bacterium]|nr:hypothetical protein [Clostridia bacterium]
MIVIDSEKKQFDNKKQAVQTLAFCHYPVTVTIGDTTRTFDSFDEAREWVESTAE